MARESSVVVDLDAYFDRVAYSGPVSSSLEVLSELHFLHPAAIPFENLSVLIGEPILLDLKSLQQKLVFAHRGGYCFEQNRFFACVLEAMGFAVTALAARVVWNREPGAITPRTHMILLIDVGGAQYITDVGFGGITLTSPLKLDVGLEQSTTHEKFRLVEGNNEFELQVRLGSDWKSMYRFDLQPQQPIDFEVSNHYVSTHRQSHFLTTLIAARPTEHGRYSLGNLQLHSYRAGAPKAQRILRSVDELKDVLTEIFGIELPQGAALDRSLARIAAIGE